MQESIAEIAGPEYAAAVPPSFGAPQETRDDSLASLAEMGITVREVG